MNWINGAEIEEVAIDDYVCDGDGHTIVDGIISTLQRLMPCYLHVCRSLCPHFATLK